MPYKGKIKLLQSVEEFKRPADNDKDCKKHFEAYCEANNFVTLVDRAKSAQNPMYYDYLLDYVGYAEGAKKDEYVEHIRSTYIKAAGRMFMLTMVADAYSKENRCNTRVVLPQCEFLPANTANTTICRASVRIEALFPGSLEWQTVFEGNGTAKRQGGGGYNDFYIEKAETAARTRAIAAAGIGIDIQGGFSTIEDAQAAYEEDQAKPEPDERMKIQILEARIRACLTAKDPMASIQAVTKEMKEESKALNKNAQMHLSNIFEEVLAKITVSTSKTNGDAR